MSEKWKTTKFRRNFLKKEAINKESNKNNNEILKRKIKKSKKKKVNEMLII